MRPDDPEYLECTCVHRTLKDQEKMEIWLPSGRIITFAKDCPVHGIIITKAEDVATPESA